MSLFAVGWNLTSISPTTPTFGFFISNISSSSKSFTIFSTFLLNSNHFPFCTFLHAISFQRLYNAFADPLTFSYGLTLYKTLINKSPYNNAIRPLLTKDGVISKPGCFSIPREFNEIIGILSKPASFNAFLMNPI